METIKDLRTFNWFKAEKYFAFQSNYIDNLNLDLLHGKCAWYSKYHGALKLQEIPENITKLHHFNRQ